MFTLREYQVAPYKAGIDFYNQSEPKPGIIVAPTAFGKSILIAHLANDIKGRTLVIQPSKELLEQNHKKFQSLGGHASIYSASFNKKYFAGVTYATIGSITKQAETFKRLGYMNLIIDEAHLYPRTMESMIGRFL